jgi:hypothetical protein
MTTLNARNFVPLFAILTCALGCNDSGSSGSTAVTLSGTVVEGIPGTGLVGEPAPGVEVCQFDSNNCATTDASGLYALRLQQSREIELSYIKEGFGPVLVATVSGAADFSLDVTMATDEDLADFFAEIDSTYPPAGSGYLSATAFHDGARLAGVSYGIAGSSGRSFYLGDDGLPDSALQETQDPGVGGFVEVAPTGVTLSVSGAANCTSDRTWPAAASNSFRLPIRVGFWTQTAIDCE